MYVNQWTVDYGPRGRAGRAGAPRSGPPRRPHPRTGGGRLRGVIDRLLFAVLPSRTREQVGSPRPRWRSPRVPERMVPSPCSWWTTKSRSATPSASISSSRGTRSSRGVHRRGGARHPPPAEDHGHAPRREPAGHQRHRSGPADHGARAHHRPPHAHRRQRRHHRRPLHAARRTRLPHQADRPRPPGPRHHLGARSGATACSKASRSTAGSRRRWRSARPSGGWSRPPRSGSRSPRSRRWSTRSRPRTPTSAVTRRAWPTSRAMVAAHLELRRRGESRRSAPPAGCTTSARSGFARRC